MATDIFTFHELHLLLPDNSSLLLNSSGTSGSTDGRTTNSSFKAISIELTRTLEANTVNVEIPRQSNYFVRFQEMLLSPIVLDEVFVRYSIVINFERKHLLYGKLHSTEITHDLIKLSIIELTSYLGHGQVYRLSRTCRNVFGDLNCKFNLGTVISNNFVNQISEDRLLVSMTNNVTFNRYIEGQVLWKTVGQNTASIVAFNDVNQFFLYDPIPLSVKPGDFVVLLPGCDKDFNACLAYNNTINFGGMPDSPNYLIGSSKIIGATKNLRG